MSKHRKTPPRPGDTPFLMPQPTQGDPIDALELVNRYGTYEIQPTTDSENFYPSIGAGTLDSKSLHRLRQQTDPGTGERSGRGTD